jgi:hypothetical protein
MKRKYWQFAFWLIRKLTFGGAFFEQDLDGQIIIYTGWMMQGEPYVFERFDG